jgi:hypothetical protein
MIKLEAHKVIMSCPAAPPGAAPDAADPNAPSVLHLDDWGATQGQAEAEEVISEIKYVFRWDRYVGRLWLCILGGWFTPWGSRNWGIGSGRWKWIAYCRAVRNYYAAIRERKKYKKCRETMGRRKK